MEAINRANEYEIKKFVSFRLSVNQLMSVEEYLPILIREQILCTLLYVQVTEPSVRQVLRSIWITNGHTTCLESCSISITIEIS